MKAKKLVSILVIGFIASPVLAKSVVIGVGTNETIKISRLIKVAVGDSKVVKVRSLSPESVLLTGLKVGFTQLRTWDDFQKETSHDIQVVSAEAFRSLSSQNRERVARITIEFIEIDEAFSRAHGIKWPETFAFAGQMSLQSTSEMTGLNYTGMMSSSTGMITHLVKQGWAKILASPELYVRLGEEAVFHSGGEVPIVNVSEGYGKVHKKIEWKPFGITAKVRVFSPDDYHFQSDIELNISEINSSQSVDGIPAFTKRTLTTKMNSIDSETVILSGLIRQSSESQVEKLPLLGEIPLLGTLLFSKTTKAERGSELLMAVNFSMTTRGSEDSRIHHIKEKYKRDDE